MRDKILILLTCTLIGCTASPETVRKESAQLRTSFEKHRVAYLEAIEKGNRLTPETIEWLDGSAITAPRQQASADAQLIMDRWARVFFVPRVIHGELRFHKYSSAAVETVHRRILDSMQRNYIELHDYQRYCQAAWETRMHRSPQGQLPKQLQEFRNRLAARAAAVDEITPLLATLP